MPLNSIVELPTFLRHAEGILSEEDRDELKSYLASEPKAGVLIPGTGGIRKLRWAAKSKGKRGGGRVIYYFHDSNRPLFLLDFFTKGSKTDLTAQEKKVLASLVASIVGDNRS